MSNITNDNNLDGITLDVCNMADKDIWLVIKAIVDDYGIDKLPNPAGGADAMIDALIKLRYDTPFYSRAAGHSDGTNPILSWEK